MLRPLFASTVRAARSATVARAVATRSFSVVPARRGGDHHFKQPEIYTGEGAKVGEVPSDVEQATGLERLELLAKIQGKELWDMKPLMLDRLGTLDNPIVIETEADSRFVGCTGYPVETHDTRWLNVRHDHDVDRCPECGCVYKHAYRQMP